ncbi:MAG: hypothetical protein Fur0024_0160 [Patescibacteria group bacterium]
MLFMTLFVLASGLMVGRKLQGNINPIKIPSVFGLNGEVRKTEVVDGVRSEKYLDYRDSASYFVEIVALDDDVRNSLAYDVVQVADEKSYYDMTLSPKKGFFFDNLRDIDISQKEFVVAVTNKYTGQGGVSTGSFQTDQEKYPDCTVEKILAQPDISEYCKFTTEPILIRNNYFHGFVLKENGNAYDKDEFDLKIKIDQTEYDFESFGGVILDSGYFYLEKGTLSDEKDNLLKNNDGKISLVAIDKTDSLLNKISGFGFSNSMYSKTDAWFGFEHVTIENYSPLVFPVIYKSLSLVEDGMTSFSAVPVESDGKFYVDLNQVFKGLNGDTTLSIESGCNDEGANPECSIEGEELVLTEQALTKSISVKADGKDNNNENISYIVSINIQRDEEKIIFTGTNFEITPGEKVNLKLSDETGYDFSKLISSNETCGTLNENVFTAKNNLTTDCSTTISGEGIANSVSIEIVVPEVEEPEEPTGGSGGSGSGGGGNYNSGGDGTSKPSEQKWQEVIEERSSKIDTDFSGAGSKFLKSMYPPKYKPSPNGYAPVVVATNLDTYISACMLGAGSGKFTESGKSAGGLPNLINHYYATDSEGKVSCSKAISKKEESRKNAKDPAYEDQVKVEFIYSDNEDSRYIGKSKITHLPIQFSEIVDEDGDLVPSFIPVGNNQTVVLDSQPDDPAVNTFTLPITSLTDVALSLKDFPQFWNSLSICTNKNGYIAESHLIQGTFLDSSFCGGKGPKALSSLNSSIYSNSNQIFTFGTPINKILMQTSGSGSSCSTTMSSVGTIGENICNTLTHIQNETKGSDGNFSIGKAVMLDVCTLGTLPASIVTSVAGGYFLCGQISESIKVAKNYMESSHSSSCSGNGWAVRQVCNVLNSSAQGLGKQISKTVRETDELVGDDLSSVGSPFANAQTSGASSINFAIKSIWEVTRDVSYTFLGLIFIFISVITIFGFKVLNPYQIKALIGPFIVAIILIQFSYILMGVMQDASKLIAIFIFDSISSKGVVSGTMRGVEIKGWLSMLGVYLHMMFMNFTVVMSVGLGALTIGLVIFILTVGWIPFIIFAFVAFLFWIGYYAAIIILYSVAPILIVLSILPSTKQYFQMGLKAFVILLTPEILAAIFLSVAYIVGDIETNGDITSQLNSAGASSYQSAYVYASQPSWADNAWVATLSLIISIIIAFLLPAAIMSIAKNGMGAIDSLTGGFASKAVNKVGGWAKSANEERKKNFASSVVGRPINDLLTNNPFSRMIAQRNAINAKLGSTGVASYAIPKYKQLLSKGYSKEQALSIAEQYAKAIRAIDDSNLNPLQKLQKKNQINKNFSDILNAVEDKKNKALYSPDAGVRKGRFGKLLAFANEDSHISGKSLADIMLNETLSGRADTFEDAEKKMRTLNELANKGGLQYLSASNQFDLSIGRGGSVLKGMSGLTSGKQYDLAMKRANLKAIQEEIRNTKDPVLAKNLTENELRVVQMELAKEMIKLSPSNYASESGFHDLMKELGIDDTNVGIAGMSELREEAFVASMKTTLIDSKVGGKVALESASDVDLLNAYGQYRAKIASGTATAEEKEAMTAIMYKVASSKQSYTFKSNGMYYDLMQMASSNGGQGYKDPSVQAISKKLIQYDHFTRPYSLETSVLNSIVEGGRGSVSSGAKFEDVVTTYAALRVAKDQTGITTPAAVAHKFGGGFDKEAYMVLHETELRDALHRDFGATAGDKIYESITKERGNFLNTFSRDAVLAALRSDDQKSKLLEKLSDGYSPQQMMLAVANGVLPKEGFVAMYSSGHDDVRKLFDTALEDFTKSFAESKAKGGSYKIGGVERIDDLADITKLRSLLGI